jgi:MarR family transcriptional regulator, organic hydroperoxide resistance regulator
MSMEQPHSSNLPPLESMVCFSVYSAGLAFNRLYRGLLSQFGLTYPQFLVLVSLQHRDGQKVSELGEALFLESNTLTPLLQRLEKAGLVKRQRSDDDERVVLLTLTPVGAKLTQDIGCVPPQVLEATQMQISEIVALTAKLNLLAGSLRKHAKA